MCAFKASVPMSQVLYSLCFWQKKLKGSLRVEKLWYQEYEAVDHIVSTVSVVAPVFECLVTRKEME